MCSDNNVCYSERIANSWQNICELYSNEYNKPPSESCRWIFRGDRTDSVLETKLEKAFRDYDVPPDKREECEIETVREFQRKASLYLEHEPDKDFIQEWLAVMRHHGAPTRLMDCTYSFYLAVYFALAENTQGVVWALNAARFNKPSIVKRHIVTNGGEQKLKEMRKSLQTKDDILRIQSRGDKLDDQAIVCYLMENPIPLVYSINPFRLNRRLTIQQGLFLLVGDLKRSFYYNLIHCFNDKQDLKQNVHRIVLKVKKSERNRILGELKKMNISNEILFPDLDGFAKSLGERFAYREIFPPNA